MECSNIVRWNFSRIITIAGDYRWENLNGNGQKIQNQLLNDYNRFINLVRFLTNDLHGTQCRILETSIQEVFNIIKQDGILANMDKEAWFNSATKAIDRQFRLIFEAYKVTDDYCLIIPDVDTLITNPEIEKWKFEKVDRFKILLLPTVESELKKATKNNNQVKNKVLQYAEQNIINSLSSLDRLEKTLPWIDLNNINDKVIASYFEIIKVKPHSLVVLMTNNSELQEKAHLSYVPYIVPPFSKNDIKPLNCTSADIKANVEKVKTEPEVKTIPIDKKSLTPPIKVMLPPNIPNKPIGINSQISKPKPKPDSFKSTIKPQNVKSRATKHKR